MAQALLCGPFRDVQWNCALEKRKSTHCAVQRMSVSISEDKHAAGEHLREVDAAAPLLGFDAMNTCI
ncbi:MAG: hypothetical protein ABSD67_04415 [Terracidiphilus sp.]|jgi:hypothetical protein